MGFRILGTGSARPERIVTNEELSKSVDTSDEWIRERTGISRRHVSEAETVAGLAAESAIKALESSGISAADIDMILLATCSAKYNTPSAACEVQGIIGAVNAMAIDINAACTGFISALTMAEAYLSTGLMKNILVIGSETLSQIVDWSDRATCILFGDGAGAVVVTKDEKNSFIYKLGADGKKKDALICEKYGKISMDGKAIYRFATTVVPKCIQETLEKAQTASDEIDYYLLHQANIRIIEAVAKKLGQPMDKFPSNLEFTGNTSSASIPMLLDQLYRENKIRRGDRLLMSGFGAGLTYGACILTF